MVGFFAKLFPPPTILWCRVLVLNQQRPAFLLLSSSSPSSSSSQAASKTANMAEDGLLIPSQLSSLTSSSLSTLTCSPNAFQTYSGNTRSDSLAGHWQQRSATKPLPTEHGLEKALKRARTSCRMSPKDHWIFRRGLPRGLSRCLPRGSQEIYASCLFPFSLPPSSIQDVAQEASNDFSEVPRRHQE